MTKRPEQVVAEQVRRARTEHGIRQSELVARLESLGATGWRQSKIAKIERGDVKRLTLGETLELAAALGVQPSRLLTGEDEIAVAPKLVVDADAVRDWIEGRKPLVDDPRAWLYFLLRRDEIDQLRRLLREDGYEPAGAEHELVAGPDGSITITGRNDG